MASPLVERPLDLAVPVRDLARQFIAGVPSYLRTDYVRVAAPGYYGRLVGNLVRWGFSMASLMEGAAAGRPKRTALIDEVGELTYAELREQARRFAAALRAHGVAEGDRVALVARNSRVPVITMLACGYLGAVAMVMNPMSSAAQLRRTADEYRAKVVVADADHAEGFADGSTPLIVGHGSENGVPEKLRDLRFGGRAPVSYGTAIESVGRRPNLPFHPKQNPTVIMSSGTTGRPKGVVRGVPRSPQVIGSIFPEVPWRPGGVIQLTASLFHAWGWLNLNLVFATASTMVLRRHFDAREAMADITRHKVTGVISAAVFLRDLTGAFDEAVAYGDRTAADGRIGESVEFIVSSGNAIPPHLVRDLNARFGVVTCNFYGSTEHGPVAVASARELAADPDRAGTVAPGVRIAILDDDGEEVPTGEVGTIYSANSESMQGYLSAKDATTVRGRMLSTGDLGFFDEQGFLHVRGRADDMVIKGGENVYPRELEEFLGRQEAVGDVYVKGVRGEIMSRLDCYLVRAGNEAGRALDEDSLRELVRENLAEHNLPDRVVWLDELPRTDAGKVVPRLLPDSGEGE